MLCFARAIRPVKSILPLGLSPILAEDNPAGYTDYLYLEAGEQNHSLPIFTSEEGSMAAFEGVLINRDDLIKRYAMPDQVALLRLAAVRPSIVTEFYGQFRAVFSHNGLYRFYVNQIRSLQLYYYQSADLVIVASSLKLIAAILAKAGRPASPDPVGLRILLSFGYMLEDYTSLCEVKALKAGEMLELDGFGLSCKAYHRFNNEIIYRDENKALKELDSLFRRAVKLDFNYDLSLGRQHLAFLSGGLDSRMGLYAAAKEGFKDIHCLNFSQRGYADQTIAERICKEQGCALHFKALDGGDYLLRLEDNASYNDAQIILHGSAHLYQAIREQDLERFGILHSGQIGDLILGSFLDHAAHSPVDPVATAFSHLNTAAISLELRALGADYPNQELFALYNRGFNSASNGDYACAEYNYANSPFLEPAFAQFGLNIDPALRVNNRLYRRWYMDYYPQAAAIIREKTMLPVSASPALARLVSYYERASRRLGKLLGKTGYSMNPFELWWHSNPSLRAHFEPRFRLSEELEVLLDRELAEQIRGIYKSGSFTDKLQAYTLCYGLQRLSGQAYSI